MLLSSGMIKSKVSCWLQTFRAKNFFPSSGLNQPILLGLFLYQHRPRKIPEEQILPAHREGNLKYLTVSLFLAIK